MNRGQMAIENKNLPLKERDSSIDTLKFTLICLVILGHCLEVFKLYKIGLTEHIYQFIYLFHMPLFVFVSGYFMNVMQNKKKFYKGLLFILETYIIFQLPSYLISCIHTIQNPIDILNPRWAMWYLPSLIVWRLIIYNLPHNIINNKIFFITFLLLISVLGGFINYRNFAFQRIITYFPMFMTGYYCKQSELLDKIKSIPISVSIVISVIVFSCLILTDAKTSVLFYQNNSYYTQPISVESGVIFRIIWHIITFILSITLLPLLLKIKNAKFAYYGKYTLLFYVCHVFFLSYYKVILKRYGLIDYSILSIITFFFIIIALCAISNNKNCKYITNPISTLLEK